MVLSHVDAHDDDALRVSEVPLGSRGAATSEARAQTGHSAAVSYAGLVFDPNHPQAGAKQLLDQVVLFVVECCPAQTGDVEAAIQGPAVRVLRLVTPVASGSGELCDALHRP